MHLTYFSVHRLYTDLCTSRLFKLLIAALLTMFLCSCTEDRSNELLVNGAGDTEADIVTTDVTALVIEQGVSWRLAEHRSQTLSGLRYSYRLTIPKSLNSPITASSL